VLRYQRDNQDKDKKTKNDPENGTQKNNEAPGCAISGAPEW
jgi:hypothetical protein